MQYTVRDSAAEQAKRKVPAEVLKKDAVGYIRVSTEGQAKDDKFGIAAQQRAIEEYAAKNGYNMVKYYVDEISGTKDNRPEFDKILYGDDVANPPFEAVICFKSDRVARDTRLYFYYLYVLEKKNIRLLSTIEQFDEGDAMANIYRSLMMFVAEQERMNIMKRTMNGKREKKLAGGWASGTCPYGYKRVEGALVVEPKEAEIVKVVFALYDQGCGQTYIATFLTDRGFRTRSQKIFLPAGVDSIIKNRPVYAGCVRWKEGEWRKGIQEPILDEPREKYIMGSALS